METEALVIAAQAGSSAALERLLREWRPRLVRSAAAMVRNDDAVQDVVQETLIKLSRNLGDLANPAAFASWAYTILRRKGIEFFRRRARYERDGISYDESLAVSEALAQESFDIRRSEVDECIDLMRGEDRNLLRLHYWGGMELADIASHLEIAPGAAKTRLFRARGRLGDLLCD